MTSFPAPGTPLDSAQLKFLETFARSCRHSIIAMLKNSQSGHPGGSLSCIDYLSLLYAAIIGQTGEKVVVSNGHISPGVYATLAEMGWIPKADVIAGFRKAGSPYEGHVSRLVPGVEYGTGPLGIGVSAAAGFALGEKLKQSGQRVFALMGDGEAQEGQVHEMLHFAAKYKLNNLILFVDDNAVQLTDSVAKIMPLDLPALFAAAHWRVIEVDGHDYEKMWQALGAAFQETEQPIVLIGRTVMGKGVPGMEADGLAHKATWHGNAPKPDDADTMLAALALTKEQVAELENFRQTVTWKPRKPEFPEDFSPVSGIDVGSPKLYGADTLTDCRSAYGAALLDLAQRNTNVLALTADLSGSVMTKFVKAERPEQHIEVGIAEQHMLSASGALSLDNFVPFASTFGAFMSSRAKDQARVNDINHTNVKMVATHCGLSVGEDGPTHQAIDDMGSFLGMFHTAVIEPADPNHCDRIIRFVAAHFGNFYVRMGRHKIPTLTREDGMIFYDENYKYEYGKCDLLREGKDLTLIASGPMVAEALKAREELLKENISVEIVIASSPKRFDTTLEESIRKTKRVITVEDHNPYSGFGGQVAKLIMEKGIAVERFETMGVEGYQLSGKPEELYAAAGLAAKDIAERSGKIAR